MLKHAYPGVRFEVHMFAAPGVSSHIMRALAAAGRRFRPDLYIIYMGNNEYVGPFGLARAEGIATQIPSADAVQRMIIMRRLRLGQFMFALRGKWPIPQRATGALLDGPPAAHVHFMRAMDLDGAVFVRAGTSINTIIREAATAAHGGVRLVDAAAALAAASSDGIPGYDLFNDSCHLNFDGHYVIARAFFDAAVDALPEWGRQRAEKLPRPLEKEMCRRMRGHSLDKTIHVLKHFTRMSALLEEEAIQGLETLIATLEEEDAQTRQEISSRGCLEALQAIGGDYHIGMRCADTLLAKGEAAAAGEIADMLLREYPYHDGSHLLQGRLLLHAGDYDSAMDSAKRASRLFPANHQVVLTMGRIHAAQGEAEKAASLFRQAIAQAPWGWPAYEAMNKIYAERNDFSGMVREWQSMTRQFPGPGVGMVLPGSGLGTQGPSRRGHRGI